MKRDGASAKITVGECPACGEITQLGHHHCHTRELVLEAYKAALVMLGAVPADVPALANLVTKHAGKPETLAVSRFAPTLICANCNSLDAVDLGSRPGFGFSLSPAEIRRIRTMAGNHDNASDQTREALRRVRRDVAPDFNKRLVLARAAGSSIALNAFAAGKLANAQSRLALQRRAMANPET